MTIHWRALVVHFLMAPLVFRPGVHFLNFSQKLSVLKVKRVDHFVQRIERPKVLDFAL
jgi:hypothetical protein